MNLGEWIQIAASVFGVAITAVLAALTRSYVKLTAGLLEENRRLRLDAARPRISVSIRPHEAHISVLWLVVENYGGGPALNIHFEVKRRPENADLSKSLEAGLMQKGISFLGANRRIEHFLASAIGNLDELKTEPLVIEASWRDNQGEQYASDFTIDFGELEGLSSVGEPPLYEMAKHLAEIKSSLARVASGSAKLRVVSESAKEHERAQRTTRLWLELRGLSDDDRAELLRLTKERAVRREQGSDREEPTGT